MKRRGGGFSLVELVVVMFVLALLLGGLSLPLSAQGEMRARQGTERALGDIREALIGFAVINGRLPCPAAATMPSGNLRAGEEARQGTDCTCASSTSDVATDGGVACDVTGVYKSISGALPWATLGLPETDGWGRRFSYRVGATFSRGVPSEIDIGCSPSLPPGRAVFALCTPGRIEVRAASGGAGLVSGGVPAIVVSHGRNGYGAYTPDGLRVGTNGASADEIENANGDTVFVSNASNDDQLAWVSTQVLMYRMLSAGLLP